LAPLTGQFVESIEVKEGAIAIKYGRDAHVRIYYKVLMLAPATVQGENHLVWICGYHSAPTDASPAYSLGEAHEYTTVNPEYLPLSCQER
jgi:hypothetical protein